MRAYWSFKAMPCSAPKLAGAIFIQPPFQNSRKIRGGLTANRNILNQFVALYAGGVLRCNNNSYAFTWDWLLPDVVSRLRGKTGCDNLNYLKFASTTTNIKSFS
ncbi:MAG: hypothetical protein LBS08_05505 [Candidatus Symbiothrix sp.]|nr:hypothetical protein [Candidatus Symbiothrix sp.]